MKDLKLTIDLLPKGAWKNDFSRTLSKKDWDTLRHKCYIRANNTCAICGFKTNELDAHEVWDFDVKAKTQTLKDIIALCSKCHGVKHFRNSERLGFGENAKRHFLKVNSCSEFDFAAHVMNAQERFDELNKVYRWKMKADLDKFGGEDIEIKEQYIPKIINPYENVDLEQYQGNYNLLPNVISIDANNYEGVITIVCNHTNRIEWISGNEIIKTKYNFAGEFITEFSVKNIEFPNIKFRLVGDAGFGISKPFLLTSWN